MKIPKVNEPESPFSIYLPLKERLKKIAGDNLHIAPCNHKLVSYSENNLTVLGTAKLHVKSKSDADQELTFHVVETNQPGLLVLRSSQTLGLIKVVMMTKKEEEQTIPDDSSQTAKASQELREEVIKKYAKVFTGLGRLEKPYHIEVDPTVTPVVTPPPPPPPPRTIPAALRERAKREL